MSFSLTRNGQTYTDCEVEVIDLLTASVRIYFSYTDNFGHPQTKTAVFEPTEINAALDEMTSSEKDVTTAVKLKAFKERLGEELAKAKWSD
jgi:hypothetical protein